MSKNYSNNNNNNNFNLNRPTHDTNFTEMLTRTRNNINKISQRYSTENYDLYNDNG